MPTNHQTLLEQEVLALPLFDHHCHGVVRHALDRSAFEALISESSRSAPAGTTRFDSQIGLAIRRYCAAPLDLEPHPTPESYLERRNQLHPRDVHERLLRAANLASLGVETGHLPEQITDPQETGDLANTTAYEIVRLERVAEDVAETRQRVGGSWHDWYDEVIATLERRMKSAIGVKSIAAYRIGLDFDATPPSAQQITHAVDQWRTNLTHERPRLANPTLIRALLWHSIRQGYAIQLHIGYGDDDLDLHRCNPLLLTELLRSTVDSGARFMLLHCYPFHREAGYLADVFPHVYCDIGLAVNYTGARSPAVIAEAVELTPFYKALFSTDAFGAAELYLTGATLFRRGLTAVLETFVRQGDWSESDAVRVAQLIGFQNAQRAYNLK